MYLFHVLLGCVLSHWGNSNCERMSFTIYSVVNSTEEEKSRFLDLQRAHLDAASKSREYMNKTIELARTKFLEGSACQLQYKQPLTGPVVAQYGFDFAQQVSYTGRRAYPVLGLILYSRVC